MQKLKITLFLVVNLLFTVSVYAQKYAPEVCKIKTVKVLSIKTPKYSDNKHSVKNDWGLVVVELATKAGDKKDPWLDSLQVVFKVLVEDRRGNAVVLTRKIDYQDVPDGNAHHAAALLTPMFIQRFMEAKQLHKDKISVYVELIVNGVKMDSYNATRSRHTKAQDWYRERGSKSLADQYFLPPSMTPYYGIDYDYYLCEKLEYPEKSTKNEKSAKGSN